MSSDPPPSSGDPPVARPMPAFIAAGWALGATLIFLLLASLTVTIRPGAATDLVSQIGCQAAAYLLALFLILRVHAPDAPVRDFLGLRSTHLGFYPIAALLGGALVVPASAIADAVQNRFPLRPSEESLIDIFSGISGPRRAAMLVAIGVIGPILEEVLFRGALFKPLLRFYASSKTTVVITTAILFAMVHLEWQRSVHIVLIGLCMGYLRLASGSLVPSVLLHITFNAIPLWAALTLGKPGAQEPDIPLPLWLIAATSVAVGALLGLARIVEARSEAAQRAQELDRV